MKHLIVVLLCLLLCGCGQKVPLVPSETVPEETAADLTAGLYDPDHFMEQQYPGLVRAYPLKSENTQGILALGKDILVLSGESRTKLTIFTGENLQESAGISLDFPLQPEDPSFQIHEDGISFFDPVHQTTVLLKNRFQEIQRIPAPPGLSGKPILSSGEDTLYYCTGWSVTAWDLKSGIRKTLKEMAYDDQELSGLHQKDQILECTIRDGETVSRQLLAADQGLEIRQLSENDTLYTEDSRYFAALEAGFQTLLLFGETGASPELLLPEGNWNQQFYLPEDHAAVTVSSAEGGYQLDYYELSTGILRSTLTLNAKPKAIVNTKDHGVYILTRDPEKGCDILYRWDVLRQPPEAGNTKSFITDYSSTEGLEACRQLAGSIEEIYGIRILLAEDAVAVQPWDYQFQPETLAPIVQKELQLLQMRLAQYPQTVLEETKSHFAGLTLCLVRSITGTGESAGLTAATGIQFFNDQDAYVVITAGRYSEQALYHELYHVMETHILTESTALDSWETLSPTNFSYGQNQPEESETYLKGQTRAFVDHYSMASSKEDRARILENAMLPGKQDLFQSEYMQRKLSALCTGIREAYALEKHPDSLPWEQYLINPLMPK